ncbi:ferredoxin [Micromonospora matsumotoense]|uniref:ferredoxin n=1 Tax=Micromonospora matsumotoense TaxID=121616 RepID=UPI0033D9685F
MVVSRGLCIGAGQCVLSTPELFDQSDDGRVLLRRQPVDAEEARVAVDLCPSGALRLAAGRSRPVVDDQDTPTEGWG